MTYKFKIDARACEYRDASIEFIENEFNDMRDAIERAFEIVNEILIDDACDAYKYAFDASQNVSYKFIQNENDDDVRFVIKINRKTLCVVSRVE